MATLLNSAVERARRPKKDGKGRVLRKDLYFHETGYYPHESQWEIHKNGTRHKGVSNGRRWGKTLLGAKEAEITSFVRNKLGEAQRGWIVGPNYDDGEKEFRILYNSLKKLGVDEVSNKFLNNTDQGRMHITTNWGWDCQVKSAAHPETLVGEGLDWVLLVEAGRLHRSTFAQYIRPALSDHRGWSLATGVPEIATDISLLYWAWTRGQDPAAKQWASWRMPSWTNPVIFPGGREDEEILEAEADLTEDEFRRQYGGEFVERYGRVMKEWDDEIHLTDIDYDPSLPLYAAVDYGYTNPFVWLWIQVDVWGTVYVLGEHYIELQDTDEIARRTLKDHPLMDPLVAFYPDPAEPDDTNTLQRVLRKPARTNTGGSLKVRLNLLRHSLLTGPEHAPIEEQKPQLLVDRSCKMLAWEMREGYRWPRHKSEVKNDSELPVDKDNHGPEALGRFFKGYFDAVEGTRRTRQSRVRIKR
jgi:hypothetical protein